MEEKTADRILPYILTDVAGSKTTGAKTVNLVVDNRQIEAEEGSVLLHACLANEIYIPNLCWLEGMERPSASCRLCFVELEDEDKPVTSCTTKVREGMVVNTDTSSVRRLQRTAFRFLLSAHRVDCGPCPANKKCELQRIARFLKIGLKPGRLDQVLKVKDIEDTHPVLDFYPNRCVLCGKCAFVCKREHGKPFLTFARRGVDTVISFFGEKEKATLPCGQCIACIEICPVCAITLKQRQEDTFEP